MSSRPHAFEERLKAALLARLPEAPPTPAPSRARRYGIPLAVGVATAVVVAVMAVPGSSRDGSRPAVGPTVTPSPSDTGLPRIRKNPDGSLRVMPPDPYEVRQLVDALTEAGVPAVLVPLRAPSQCSEPVERYRGLKDKRPPATNIIQNDDQGYFLKVDAKTVPPGHSLVITQPEHFLNGYPDITIGVVETSKVPSCGVDEREGLEEILKAGPAYPSGEPAGTIRIPLPTVDELPAVVERLREQGVSVAVTESLPASECTHPSGGYRGLQADPEAELRRPERDKLKINSKTVPPGYTLVFGKSPGSPVRTAAGVKPTSKVTPCEIDASLDREEENGGTPPQ
ncbi:hypothetical protein [Streptomyces sp. NPDC059072]|uniref:hypothetical protein n=1 Tax=unclassified Streptomyces TaxID=2593676 RepID=UPI00369050F6